MRTKMTAIRKEAGRKIDPETAEVLLGFFARSPGSDVWVWFGDLSDATRDALWEKYRSKPFPADLPWP